MIILTSGEEHWIVENYGESMRKRKFPGKPNTYVKIPLHIHPTKPWLIYMSQSMCDGVACNFKAYVSKNYGNDWSELSNQHMRSCKWAAQVTGKEDSVVCLKFRENSKENIGKLDLVYSDDFFKTQQMGLESVDDFLVMGKFVLAGRRTNQLESPLQLFVSVNGVFYARSLFATAKQPKEKVCKAPLTFRAIYFFQMRSR